jgi:hypothetical protein
MVNEKKFSRRFFLCRPFHLPEGLLFFLLSVETDDLFRASGYGCPGNVDGVAHNSLVATAVHVMVGLEVTNDRLDFGPLFQRSFEPWLCAVRMRLLSFLRDCDSSHTPSSIEVLLFFR